MEETKQTPCEDKIAYESADEARAAIAANSYFHNKPNLGVYQCRHCQLYHVTTQTKDEDD